ENTSVTDATKKGYGILASDATFSASASSTSVPTQNTFENLYYGIYAFSSNPLRTFTSQGNEFINNSRGISCKGMNYSKIISNVFDVGSCNNIQSDPGIGLYLENCTAYKVEDNHFTSTHGGTYGTAIYNNGFNTNYIYKNYYSNLNISTISANSTLNSVSRAISPPPVINLSGLQVKCNHYTNSGMVDLAVTTGQIGSPQGLCNVRTSPANNIFSHIDIENNNLWDIFTNPTVTPFGYCYTPASSDITGLWNYNSSIVTPIPCSSFAPFDETTDCPSTLGTGSGTGTGTAALIAKINAYNTQINTLSLQIDGGNTQNILNKINSNLAGGKLKNAILANGSYSSDTVLIATIKKSNPLPPGILKEIIVPN
ncbi:MAG TPA: hypothetical protein DEH02_19230, partial [Bacteroidales bacterium]|nr:hypothetical protein [Bacteroidales bacterium]